MPGIATGNIISLKWSGICFNQLIQYGLTLVCDVAPTSPDVTTGLNNILSSFGPGGANDQTTAYLALLPPQYTLTSLNAQVIYPTRSAYASLGGGGLVGTGPAATAANDSAAFTLRTALAGRKQVSTKKIGPIGDGARAAGGYTILYAASLAAFAGFQLGEKTVAADGGQYHQVIYHRTSPGQYDYIESFIVASTARVHRRRTVGIGR